MTDGGVVDRDGFKLAWFREGNGLPMMVLGGPSFYRRYFPQPLREHFEIVFCDLRQWVPTPEGFDIRTITRDTFSDDIDAVRRAAGLERPIVVGQSQHGAIALEYAHHSPGSLRGVVAVAPPPPRGGWDGQEPARDFFERDASPERKAAHERYMATRRATIETSQEFIDDYIADPAWFWYDHSFDCSPLWEGAEPNLPVMDQLFEPEGLGGYEVAGLDVPVLLALGRYDYGVPSYVWDEPKKGLANLRYRLYERSGHHPPYEQPEEFVADTVAWARDL